MSSSNRRTQIAHPTLAGSSRRFGLVAITLLVAVIATFAGTEAYAGDPLSFEDRVHYQRAIEEVYWRHRIWPAENPSPKPAFEALLSDDVLRERVETYLAKSVALELFWSRPLTGEQLQAEMNRMVRDTRNPELLGELFAALDHDPFLVAECLARPLLVSRLVSDSDERTFDAWRKQEGRSQLEAVGATGIVWPPPGGYRLQAIRDGGCTEDSWVSKVYVPGLRSTHTAVWTGAEMIVWGGYDGSSYLNTGGRYDPATDSWTETSTEPGVPEGRRYHTAVWTGTEMIVWAGTGADDDDLGTGGRYDPGTDTWTATATGSDAAGFRRYHTAVWTGTEMIVWGGTGVFTTNTGSRYDPSTDSWNPTSTGEGVPTARDRHTAVWTGSRMIVWGGLGGGYQNTGASYDPVTDSWTPTSTGIDVPSGRYYHTAVWTGSEMIVWGGWFYGGGYHDLDTGGRYDPATDSWTATSTSGDLPLGRRVHTAVWTGSEMIVWGGLNDNDSLNSGGTYVPGTDEWTSTSTSTGRGSDAPAGRTDHTAVWTGTEMIVWGGRDVGYKNTGGRYDPTTDDWTATSLGPGVPSGRERHTAVWTGAEMIVWGGEDIYALNSGGRYDPATDSWTHTSMGPNVPTPRSWQTAVWTGTEMIVWGGRYYDSEYVYPNSGGRYDPVADAWTETSVDAGVPDGRYGHAAVWTGTEMIVWGGQHAGLYNTGGRYDPVTDSWSATSIDVGVPTGRRFPTAVWSGTEMIVWGGYDGAYPTEGGRYDPSKDAWTPTLAALPGAILHSAVWTGTKMIVWGGYRSDGQTNWGGQYDPATETWSPTSRVYPVPQARSSHTAVWTGTYMIIFGGASATEIFTHASRYDPAADWWTWTLAPDVPVERYAHSAVWTGTEMIIWGGIDGSPTSSLGRYCVCDGDSVNIWYPDADGDGYGSGSTGIPSCSQPSGYIAVGGDCDDTNADIYAGAPEINDGLDNQCPGEVGHGLNDEITGGCGFHDPDSTNELSWSAQAGATGYEVARSTDPEFEADCVVEVTASTYWDDGTSVPLDACFYYLVRSTQPNVGSWGADSDGVERIVVCP